nr:hypothetical protein [Tanacetum cinerariifolium]
WEVVVCGWASAGGHGNVSSGCCHGGDVVVRMAAGVVVLAVGDRSGCCHGGDVVVRLAAWVVVLAVGDRRSSEVAEKVTAVHGVGGWWIG